METKKPCYFVPKQVPQNTISLQQSSANEDGYAESWQQYISPNGMVEISANSRTILESTGGTLWVTSPGLSQDWLLPEGQRLCVHTKVKLIVSAVDDLPTSTNNCCPQMNRRRGNRGARMKLTKQRKWKTL